MNRSNSLWDAVARQIRDTTGQPFTVEGTRSIGGGSINSAYRVAGSDQIYFVKCNRASGIEMFTAEMEGLAEIAATQAIRVPKPICCGVEAETSFLVLEYLELGSSKSSTATDLGQQLAAMHRHERDQFGWTRNNTIGSTPQINTLTDRWIDFYREHRLGYQVRLARRQGYSGAWNAEIERLMDQLDQFFVSYHPTPSLLHGDLWGGNYGTDRSGHAVLFDPAVYYGDRETDLAMTELFGGFPSQFYTAYDQAYPIDPGYEVRKPLYQLYHLLNHLNLFGGGYLGSVQSAIQRCLKAIR